MSDRETEEVLATTAEAPWPSFAGLVAEHAALRPDARALDGPDASASTQAAGRAGLTWAELDALVERTAGALGHRGLRAGQRLALLGSGSVAYVVALLAALRAGIVVVPLDPHTDLAELADRLRDTRPRLLLADPAVTGPEIPGGADLAVAPLTLEGLRSLGTGAHVVTPADPEALAALLYTTGTSSEPRAAMLSQRALGAHLRSVADLPLGGPETVTLGAIPLDGAFGVVAVLGSWLLSGGRLVLASPDAVSAALLRESGVTHLPLTPLMLVRLLHAGDLDLGTVGLVVSGGGPLPDELADDFSRRTGLSIAQGYGITELPAVASTLAVPPRASSGAADSAVDATESVTAPPHTLGHGYVGQPLRGVQVRIGDGADESEPGEIAVRGSGLFSGYWPDGSGGPDARGWFASGDLGYRADGELFWVDRLRDLVKVSGFRVYPAEVEQAIGQLDGVSEVAVLGTETGVVAVVAPRPDAGLTAAAVEEHCARTLPRFKRPRRVILVDRLPHGISGMVRKSALRRLVAEL